MFANSDLKGDINHVIGRIEQNLKDIHVFEVIKRLKLFNANSYHKTTHLEPKYYFFYKTRPSV